MTSENYRLWSEANRRWRDPVAVQAVEEQGVGE
jgi:hypothetical protein